MNAMTQVLLGVYVIGFLWYLMLQIFGYASNIAPKLNKELRMFDIGGLVILVVGMSALWPIVALFLLVSNLFGSTKN